VIVRDDLGSLYRQDLHGNVIAAVRSISVPHVSDPFGLSQWEELGLPATTPFFNSGVLVIDTGAWGRADMTRRILDFVSANGDELKFAEQDGMNAVIAGAFQPLPLRWNQESAHRDPANPFHPYLLGYAALPEDEVREALHNPALTHFTGPVKPWHPGCTDPAGAEWWALPAATAFDNRTSAWSRFTSRIRPAR
jgi:lipopolysaccharide biosynthesis glycosyltransferase